MRKGRGIDHYWDIRRYMGDASYYAFCRCGYYYLCGSAFHKDKPENWVLYHYCPKCGAHKKYYNSDAPRYIDKFIYE